jgi:sugar/nucleoside kinase (ribokinase family)
VGEDTEKSGLIINSLKKIGLDYSGLYVKAGARTAAFSATLNGRGDFLSGIADMDVLANLPEAHLERFSFTQSKIVLVDSNLSHETLSYILNRCGKEVEHVIFEPISKEKAGRIMVGDLLSKVTLIKPNVLQLKDLAETID